MPLFSLYRLLLVFGLIAGFGLWAASDHPLEPNRWHWLALALTAGLSLIPPVNRAVTAVLDRVRDPTHRARAIATAAVVLLSTGYLIGTALWHDRALVPRCHDEHSYAIQTQLVAHGRLWMPRHPVGDFFESFHVITEPVYAAIYFPGTAILNAPGVWMHLPVWVVPSVLAGLVVGLAYRITTEAIDGVAGILAALLAMAPYWFRAYSTVVMSQIPAALLGLATIWAWLHWRRNRHWAWALMIGVFAGWGAITRPADALAFAAPVGVAMILQLRRGPISAWSRAAIPILVGAAPFLSLQVLFNKGTTGDAFLSPYVHYLRQSQPNTAFGFHRFDPSVQPDTGLEQKRVYYTGFMREVIEAHQLRNLPREVVRRWWVTSDLVTPMGVGLVLVPVGVLAVLSRRQPRHADRHGTADVRLVVFAVLPLFFLLYLPNTFYLEHYVIPLIVPAAFVLCAAAEWLSTEFAGGVGRALTTFATGAVAVLAVSALPEFNDKVVDEFFIPQETLTVDRVVREAIPDRAVLLVKFRRGDNPHDEPVYNWTVPWPDDARVVRAHDLGPRNVEIIRYYAERQPERQFFRFDRRERALQPLGRADALWAALRAKPQAPSTTTASPG